MAVGTNCPSLEIRGVGSWGWEIGIRVNNKTMYWVIDALAGLV